MCEKIIEFVSYEKKKKLLAYFMKNFFLRFDNNLLALHYAKQMFLASSAWLIFFRFLSHWEVYKILSESHFWLEVCV